MATRPMPERPNSYLLEPGRSHRCNAGSYDIRTGKPAYRIHVSVPSHVRHQVKQEQFLIRTGDGHLWIWDVKNESSWPAVITVTRDGEKIPIG